MNQWNRYLWGAYYGLLWAGERDDQLIATGVLGHMFHAIEDFFSHSNWVNNDDLRNFYTPFNFFTGEVSVGLTVVGLLLVYWAWNRRAPDAPSTLASPSDSGTPGVLASRKLSVQGNGVSGLHGRVSDPGSTGIREAKVCAYPMRKEQAARSTPDLANPVCVTSNEDGNYAFVGIAAGSYKLMASAPRYQPTAVDTGNNERLLALPEGEEIGPLDIVLRPGGVELRGRVRESGGTTPIAGALVTLMLTDRKSGAVVTSDGKGEFSAWIAEGALTVMAEAAGYAPATRHALSPGPNVDIELEHGGTLLVRVVDAATKQPLPDAMIETGAPTQRFGQTDSSGRVTFDRLAAGRYKPRAMTRGYYGVLNRSVFVATAESTSEVMLELHAVNTIEGRVVYQGSQRPCTAGEVTLHEGTTKTTFTTIIMSDGRFVFPTVPPGLYEVIKTCKNATKSIDAKLLVVRSPMKDLVLEVTEGVSLRGVIVSEEGAPIRDATITAWGPVAPPRKGVFKVETTSDASGVFALVGVVPTWAKLNATAASFAPIDPAVQIDIAEGGKTDDVRLVMKRPRRSRAWWKTRRANRYRSFRCSRTMAKSEVTSRRSRWRTAPSRSGTCPPARSAWRS